MSVIKAIPKSLLIHTVTHAKAIDLDRWGAEQLIEKQELDHVRLEPSSKMIRDKNNAEVRLAALLFYDCRNSRPRDVELKEDDIIVFHGETYRVQVCEPLYDNRKLHHYELGFVRHA